MRIVLATRALAWPGGSETYLLTVAEALQRLGHGATIHCHEEGEAAELARERGTPVETSLDAVDACDAALAQDAPAAYELAERFANVPILFVAHSRVEVQVPPQLAGVCPAAVAMNDRIAEHLRALAVAPEVVRLRQPVDRRRFRALGISSLRAPRVVAFGNNLPRTRERMLAAACGRLGYEFGVLGDRGGAGGSLHPEVELADAQIALAIGRCAVEAMACAKAVYVYGLGGGDGWVTPSTYPALEADGFTGRGTDSALDVDVLTEELAWFGPTMGRDNLDLAAAHHDALDHARELIEVWRRLGAPSPQPSEAAELARMGRLQRQTEETSATFEMAAQSRGMALERAEADRDTARAELAALKGSLRYRIGAALAWPLDAIRRIRARRRSRGR